MEHVYISKIALLIIVEIFFFLGKKIFIVSKQKNRQKYKRLIYTTYINYIQKKKIILIINTQHKT